MKIDINKLSEEEKRALLAALRMYSEETAYADENNLKYFILQHASDCVTKLFNVMFEAVSSETSKEQLRRCDVVRELCVKLADQKNTQTKVTS